MKGWLNTAGERLRIECDLPWVADLIEEAHQGELLYGQPDKGTVSIRVEADRGGFDHNGWEPLTRGAWRNDGEVLIADVCSTGFDLLLRVNGSRPEFRLRWHPSTRNVAARHVLRSRFVLLVRAVLLQYPAMWWAASRGRAPLHACAVTAESWVPVLAGPSGIGKSTLLMGELAHRGRAISDNLCVSDGTTVWGVAEPLRIEGGSGRRMPHGRREVTFPRRASSLLPNAVVVLHRGSAEQAEARACSIDTAARSLITGTYMAGELRRFWAYAATLSDGTGRGPAHPPVAEVARKLAAGLACIEITLARRPGTRLVELLNLREAAA